MTDEAQGQFAEVKGMIADKQDAALGDVAVPSWREMRELTQAADELMLSQEEVEEFVQAVNGIVEIISEAIEGLTSVFIPSIRAIRLVLLRMALAMRLCSMWNNRVWHWLSWRIAMHAPAIFLTRLLPVRFLVEGLCQSSVLQQLIFSRGIILNSPSGKTIEEEEEKEEGGR